MVLEKDREERDRASGETCRNVPRGMAESNEAVEKEPGSADVDA